MSESASIRYHLAQLAALSEAHPVSPKAVFVPSRQIGHNMGTALARAGIAWANLHLTTPADWAERLAGPRLRASGRRPLVQDADRFFMLACVREAPWPRDHPFAQGRASGLVDTFLRTIRGLRLAGIEPHELAGARMSFEAKQVFIDLYHRYCVWLDEEGLYDRALLYREAAAGPSEPNLIVAVLDETPLPETAFRFVRSLAEDIYRIGRPDYGVAAPQHSSRERFYDRALAGDGRGTVGRAGLLHVAPERSEGPEGVILREAIGVESEIRGGLRELLAGGATVDQIELVYATEDPYLPLIVDATDHLGLPASFAEGVPVMLTRTGQAVAGFFRWIGAGFDLVELIRLLRSRLVFLSNEEGAATTVDGPAVAGILLEARIGTGRYSWRGLLRRMLERLQADAGAATPSRSAYARRRCQEVRGALEWLDALFDLVPERDPTSLSEIAEAGVSFMRRFALHPDSERDRRAAESLEDRLKELGRSAEFKGSLVDLAHAMAALVQDHKIEAAVARPGRLYVVPLARSGYTGREHTLVVGLSEATFPGAPVEDPVLLDREREEIGSGRLQLQRERAGEPSWHLARLLGAAAGDVILTANRRDLTEGREMYPAAVFEHLKRQLGLECVRIYGVVPDSQAALTSDEVALALREHPRYPARIAEDRPWLQRGIAAAQSRSTMEPGVFDGWVGRETPELRPGDAAPVSASRLEDLAACPYRYFLKNVLHVRPPDVAEDVPGRWLSPLEFGSLLHDVLRSFMESVVARGERVDAERHEGLMADVLARAVDEVRQRIPVQHEAGFRVDVRRLERATRVFLAEESRRDVRPVGFEVSFGMGEEDGLSVPDPVRIRLTDGLSITLIGSIDRVDKSEDGFEVWDYKSGSGNDYDEYDMLAGGRRLQWALYAYVLDELLRRAGGKGHTVRSGYFFASDREHGWRLRAEPPPREELGRVLEPLFEMVRQGAFLRIQKHNACTFCDYRSVCSSDRIDPKDADAVVEAASELSFGGALRRWTEV